jgi:DNA repair photolyase
VVGDAEPAVLFSNLAGQVVSAPIKGNSPDCACNASRDIGAYDTCPHGCTYCYAVTGPDAAKTRYAAHNPASDLI